MTAFGKCMDYNVSLLLYVHERCFHSTLSFLRQIWWSRTRCVTGFKVRRFIYLFED